MLEVLPGGVISIHPAFQFPVEWDSLRVSFASRRWIRRLRRIVVLFDEGAIEAGEERREVLEGLVGLWVVEEGHYLLFTRISSGGGLESGCKPWLVKRWGADDDSIEATWSD